MTRYGPLGSEIDVSAASRRKRSPRCACVFSFPGPRRPRLLTQRRATGRPSASCTRSGPRKKIRPKSASRAELGSVEDDRVARKPKRKPASAYFLSDFEPPPAPLPATDLGEFFREAAPARPLTSARTAERGDPRRRRRRGETAGVWPQALAFDSFHWVLSLSSWLLRACSHKTRRKVSSARPVARVPTAKRRCPKPRRRNRAAEAGRVLLFPFCPDLFPV